MSDHAKFKLCNSCKHLGVCKYYDNYSAIYEYMQNLEIADADDLKFQDFVNVGTPIFTLSVPNCAYYNN